MKWSLRRHPVVKQDSADALAAAQAEVDLSRQRLRDTHEKVVRPLRAHAAENSFADLIRRSIIDGYRGGEKRHDPLSG